MDTQSLAKTRKLPPEPTLRPPRLGRLRSWLSGCTGRVITFSIALLLGIVLGIGATLIFALSIGGSRPVLPTSQTSQEGAIIIQVGISYTTQLVDKDLQATGVVNASNVQVAMAQGDLMTITGDEAIAFGFTRPFTIVIQPVISHCQLQMHTVSANLAGIPVTTLVANFENTINQELQSKNGTLPSGFVYCKTNVRTDAHAGLFLTFSAKAV